MVFSVTHMYMCRCICTYLCILSRFTLVVFPCLFLLQIVPSCLCFSFIFMHLSLQMRGKCDIVFLPTALLSFLPFLSPPRPRPAQMLRCEREHAVLVFWVWLTLNRKVSSSTHFPVSLPFSSQLELEDACFFSLYCSSVCLPVCFSLCLLFLKLF